MGISERNAQVINSIPYLLEGVGITLEVTVIALIIGAVLGLLLALARVYGGNFSRRFSIVYSRIIRSLPLLVILFMLFYFGDIINLTKFQTIVFSLAMHTSAYQSEIFRGAIQSISKGQMEAALALGMSKFQCIFTIILPQALRRSIPYWSNEAAIVLKDSSMAYVLGVTEVMRRGEYVSARTGQPLLTYFVVGLIYFILTYVFTKSLSLTEARLKIPE
jgi:polar amino acid transport system permease protein